MKIIAHIRTDFPDKFGIPRQSGLVESLKGTIIFEPEYRNPEAFKEGKLVSYREASKAGGKEAYGSVCHQIALSPQ